MAGNHQNRSVPKAVRKLLTGIVDYAGLFPPAALELGEAARNFGTYRSSPDAWALGRFVIPAGRLEELARLLTSDDRASRGAPWLLSALIGPDVPADLEKVGRVNAHLPEDGSAGRSNEANLLVDSVELKASTPDFIAECVSSIPESLITYVEIPLDSNLDDFVDPLRTAGARAKVRTGGVTTDLFPHPDSLVRFLVTCIEARLPFKATAGLHHPVAGRYRLTYEPDSASAGMYGYLNLLFATALLRYGAPEHHVLAALGETEAESFRLGENFMAWGDYIFDCDDIRSLRQGSFVSFGSCSFREPLDELNASFGGEWSRTERHLIKP